MNAKPTSLRFENLVFSVSHSGRITIYLPVMSAEDLNRIAEWIDHDPRAELHRHKAQGNYIVVTGFEAPQGGTRIRGVILELEASGATNVDFSKASIAMLLPREKKRITIIEPRRPSV